MTESTISTDIHEPLHVHRDFGSKSTLYLVITLDDGTDLSRILFGHRLHSDIGTDPGFLQDLPRRCLPNAKDVRQRNLNALLVWQIHSSDTCQEIPPLLLPLLVTRIAAANHAYHTAAADDLTELADLLY